MYYLLNDSLFYELIPIGSLRNATQLILTFAGPSWNKVTGYRPKSSCYNSF
jgi:hypothetical protein